MGTQGQKEGGRPDPRLVNTRAYLSHLSEAQLGPVLMSLGIILAITSYALKRPTTFSVDLSLVGLTSAMVGSAMEMAFLLIVSRVLDVMLGRRYNMLFKVIGIAAMMTAYMIIIGMPILGAYLERLMAREGLAEGGLSGQQSVTALNPLWLYSLLTFGFILFLVQRNLSIRLLRVIDNILGQGSSEPLSSHS
jgi:hypothetical protein